MHTAQNAQPSDSTPTPSPKNLQTTTSAKPANLPIGIEHSSRGLETLRSLAQSKPNAETVNRQLLESLRQDLGSRLVIKERFNKDYELISVAASISGSVDPKWLSALEYYTAPSKGDAVAMEVTRLRTLTAKRKEGEFDLELSIGAITEELIEYPRDIVRHVCREWARNNKFFPVLKELLDECKKLNAPRKALLIAMRNSNLIEFQKPEEQQTETTPEDSAKIHELVQQALKNCAMGAA